MITRASEPIVSRKAGYVALAADLHGDGVVHKDLPSVMPVIQALYTNRAEWRSMAQAAFDALVAQPLVDRKRIGAIGFLFRRYDVPGACAHGRGGRRHRNIPCRIERGHAGRRGPDSRQSARQPRRRGSAREEGRRSMRSWTRCDARKWIGNSSITATRCTASPSLQPTSAARRRSPTARTPRHVRGPRCATCSTKPSAFPRLLKSPSLDFSTSLAKSAIFAGVSRNQAHRTVHDFVGPSVAQLAGCWKIFQHPARAQYAAGTISID